MKTNRISSWVAAVSLLATNLVLPHTAGAGGDEYCRQRGLAFDATSPDAAKAKAAVKALRDLGPAGMQVLSEMYSNEITKHLRPAGSPAEPDEAWERVRAAFDRVGRQRDNYVSQLYWFTDFEAAKAAARASGKPILSLRLLGQLDEEYSCANSRFFRTTLYPNTEVSDYLRDHFVLHWQSVRPVPRITIDMGDGRRIERTITGNSIHYILDADGRPLDALPGLYGPKTFLRELGRAADVATRSTKVSSPEREALLGGYHATRLQEIREQWARDLQQVGAAPQNAAVTLTAASPAAKSDANAAMARTMSKAAIEAPMLRNIQPGSSRERTDLERLSTDSIWKAIAALHREEARLDSSARALILGKQPNPEAANRVTATKAFVETPMMRMLRNLERSIAEDTVRNEYQLHSRIHEWFSTGAAPAKLDALNTKVYAELFLTPDSDPWLGLAPADVFSALDHGGLTQLTR